MAESAVLTRLAGRPQVRDAGIQRVVAMLQMEMRLHEAEKREIKNQMKDEHLAMSYRVGAEVQTPPIADRALAKKRRVGA